MKKILIVNNNLDMGGIQKSLVNLVKSICGEYDITLLLFSKSGPLLQEIPENVKIVTPLKVYSVLGLEKKDLKKRPVLFVLKAFLLAYAKIFSRRSAMRLIGIFQKKIRGYDAVISYTHLSHPKSFRNGCGEFVLDKTECENKLCLIHCDYLNFGGQAEVNNRTYDEFDKIACCSESVRERFLIGSGIAEKKVYTLRNFYDLRLASRRGNENGVVGVGFINVLIVARLSEEKGIPRAIEALFLSGRRDIHYYIIGDGPQKEAIEQVVGKYRMAQFVTMLGEQNEPYKYLKRVDWLLVPSFHEAAPIVYDEAKLMGIKIITTNTTSACEIVGDKYGIVCENTTDGLVSVLKNIEKTEGNDHCCFDNELQRTQFASLF